MKRTESTKLTQGKIIKEYRKQKKMSLRVLEEKTGISKTRLSKIEKDQVQCLVDELAAIAKIDKIDCCQLCIQRYVENSNNKSLTAKQKIAIARIHEVCNMLNKELEEEIEIIRGMRERK